MQFSSDDPGAGNEDSYLFGRGPAWFAFAMTMALMLCDYIDRQVIVSLFPHIKAAWSLSDKQLGALVSIVSVTVALGAMPVAFYADRTSRVKSIFAMATAWSLASISCMFTRSYGQLLAARAVVGSGEAGYGSVGTALITSHFPARMRGALLAAFFATASVGSVLGVLLGGVIAARWGWQAAFGVVGMPGLLLALLYLRVRDYETVALPSPAAAASLAGMLRYTLQVLGHSRTMFWVCLGAAAQLIVVSSAWSWLPSYLHRFHGMASDQAAVKAALVVLCGAAGSVVWGAVADRAGLKRPRNKLFVMAALCVLALLVLGAAFGAGVRPVSAPYAGVQYAVIALGSFLMTCTVGPVAAIVMDVVDPGVRSTGASVLALCQNLFGLAAGPFIAGVLSDALGLGRALSIMPLFGLVAVLAFVKASASYEAEMDRANQAAVRPDAA